jgi:hypothetical protein
MEQFKFIFSPIKVIIIHVYDYYYINFIMIIIYLQIILKKS